jgi:hypothetical protein
MEGYTSLSRYLATIGGTHMQTLRLMGGGFMKYAVEMGSHAIIYRVFHDFRA